ncbi:MAG: BstYI [Anaerolineaceae bacterium]|jgi:hypothetical protein|nr:MAG: BstYI [Anaerolineaceae bacterium]
MKKIYEYSHLGGAEILQVHYPEMLDEIDSVITSVKANRMKESKEKTQKGKLLYSPIDMNSQFKKLFKEKGFKELKDSYNIEIPNYDKVIKGAYKQIDFCKDRVLIEVQFGKYAFMFYDLAKFQYFFNENKAAVGIEIVPSHSLKTEMSSGVSFGEQLVYDIERLKRHFPAVPIKVIFIDTDSDL